MFVDWTELYIVGASGHGKVVADLCTSLGLAVAGFIDDSEPTHGSRVLGFEIVGARSWLLDRIAAGERIAVGLGIGSNAVREMIAGWCVDHGVLLPSLVHPSASIAASARLGAGTVVMAGVAVNPDSVVGAGVILNTGCVVEHDNHIGDYAHLSANAATGGTVSIGARTHMGLNSTILPNLRVGSNAVIGAGAVVIRDLEDSIVVAGVPAKPLRKV